ncbi:MAG: DUF1080 domain-containing protein [Planctomycetaceae bacterium]
MRRSLFRIFLAVPLLASLGFAGEKAPEGKWIQLFNGKDLSGWKVKIKGHDLGENFGNTFRVKDGVMKVGYDKYTKFGAKFGHVFYEKPFSHYIIRCEYRFLGKQVPGGPGWAFRNSGIMLHCQSPESMGKNQNFPVSIEVQLLGGREQGKRPTANLCTPGTHVVFKGKLLKRHCTNSSSKTYRGDQWVKVEVEVRGSKAIRHKIDGRTVIEYTEPQLDENDKDAQKLLKGQPKLLDGGYISLQSESHPVEFRKVELLPLKP